MTLVSGSVKKEKRPPVTATATATATVADDDDDDDDVIILSDNDSPSPPMNGLSHFTELDTDLLMVMVTHHVCTTNHHSPLLPGANEQ